MARMEDLFLIVGLGNPGRQYENTRHNAGAMAVDRMSQRAGAVWTENKRFTARLARGTLAGRAVLLCRPETFMNSSGFAVAPLVNYYRITMERLLVVSDDADLPLGALRMRAGGGTGGHRGLESIGQQLGLRDFPRLKLGIGRPEGSHGIAGFVLGKLSPEEDRLLDQTLDRAAGQAACWIGKGIELAMTNFNGTLEVPEGSESS